MIKVRTARMHQSLARTLATKLFPPVESGDSGGGGDRLEGRILKECETPRSGEAERRLGETSSIWYLGD